MVFFCVSGRHIQMQSVVNMPLCNVKNLPALDLRYELFFSFGLLSGCREAIFLYGVMVVLCLGSMLQVVAGERRPTL